MNKLIVVILAAGRGERMVSTQPKVTHQIMGKPMIRYVIDRAKELHPENVVIITGYGRDKVEAYLEGQGVLTACQTEQRGTAHAVLSAEEFISDCDVIVLYGDVPLIEGTTLRMFADACAAGKHITFMTTEVDDPGGYGRVITQGDQIVEIVEDIDATSAQRKIRMINTGICMIPRRSFPLLKAISTNNSKGEYYLTDICKIARTKGEPVYNYFHENAREVLGINTREELLEANIAMKDRILHRHLRNGVTFLDNNVYVEDTVTIGRDTTLFPNCFLMGETFIGEGVSIGPSVIIRDSRLQNSTTIEGFVVMEGAEVGEGARIGPFCRIRPNTVVGKNVRVGNFVEVKNSVLREGTKANHLTYIGDSDIGMNVNIGAGTITCNYDGRKKHRTVIDDNAFVGSNTELVAPVKIGKNAVIGAGSTITKDVPAGALAVSRVHQKQIEGYARKKRCVE